MPRPTLKSEALINEVLERLRKGEPLAKICRDDGMPHSNVWRDWCKDDENLGIAYARAREDGFDAIAQECLDIADEISRDTIKSEKFGDLPDKEWMMRSKLRVETRLKLLAKWDPKRYGEMMKHAGPDGGPLNIIISPEDADA